VLCPLEGDGFLACLSPSFEKSWRPSHEANLQREWETKLFVAALWLRAPGDAGVFSAVDGIATPV